MVSPKAKVIAIVKAARPNIFLSFAKLRKFVTAGT